MENCGKVNKVGKTIGCDVFVGVRNLEKKYQIQQPGSSYLRQDNEKICFKFIEITGDKTQRDYLDIYLAKVHASLNAIIFCFDVTNLRTLSHFKKWILVLLGK